MRYHEFIDRVQEEGGFDARDEAETAIRATLSSLGECLYRTERRHLASQLPKEAEDFLYEYGGSEVTRQGAACFTLDAFYTRVGARADVTHTHAVERARAVIAVLREAMPEGEWQHIVREMPNEYRELLEGESSGAPAAG
jgi:uncharacterized protein (DUF2267 family)